MTVQTATEVMNDCGNFYMPATWRRSVGARLMTMQSIRRGDAQIAYTIHGDGPGLVLVHGTGANGSTTWAPMLKALSRERTVVLPDLRGSGATRDGGEPLALETLADDVLSVATDAELDQFDLVGFSLGGAVAACAAARAPDRIRSLVIIATPPSGRDSRSQLQFGIWKDLYDLDPQLFARYWLLSGLSPQFAAEIPADELERAATFPIESGLDRQCTLNTEIDLEPLLDTIHARTLVIGCTHDAIVPQARTRQLGERIPDARYLALDAGHMVILEMPSIVARAVLEHVNEG
jgi:3-oxoadipate enol-lactonase